MIRLTSPHGRRAWLLAATALVATAVAPSARAAGVEFAQFNAMTGSPVTFQNIGGTQGALGITTVATPVTFNFMPGYGLGTQDRAATLTLSGTTGTPATSTPILGKNYLDQPITGAGNTLTIRENSSGKILLQMTFTGDITGFSGSSVGSLSGDTTLGNTVTYYSDFVSAFSGTGNSFILGLPNITPGLAIGAGGFLASFVTNANGSFSATSLAVVPEPASVVMYGTGLAACLVLARRVRRKARGVNVG